MRYHVRRFSSKTDNYGFLGLNLGKLLHANMQYFGSNNAEGVVENWEDAEMSWVEVDGAGWGWMEVSGDG